MEGRTEGNTENIMPPVPKGEGITSIILSTMGSSTPHILKSSMNSSTVCLRTYFISYNLHERPHFPHCWLTWACQTTKQTFQMVAPSYYSVIHDNDIIEILFFLIPFQRWCRFHFHCHANKIEYGHDLYSPPIMLWKIYRQVWHRNTEAAIKQKEKRTFGK